MERQVKFQKTPARSDHAPMRLPRSSSPANRLLKLQRSIGNQATQRLIRSPYIQAKLEVSNPADPLEQEADRTAETVMRMPDSDPAMRVQPKPLSTQITRVAQQDTEVPDEEEEVVSAKSRSHISLAVREDNDEEEQVVNRKDGDTTNTATARPTVTNAAASNIHTLNGGGTPLPATSRSFFEPRFGVDLSNVRIHTDSRAVETANSINAKAFTVGRNIAFGAGEYVPESSEGQRLLAHELTHVVQQSASPQLSSDAMVQRDKNKPGPKVKKPTFDLAAMETIKANAEGRHESITNFIRQSRATLQTYKSRLLEAATLYKVAFGRHKAVLDEAKEDAADRKELISTIAGFAVGVTLGVPGAVARIGLSTLAQRASVAFSIGGELAELAIGGAAARIAGGPDDKAFEPTAEIPELKELAVWQKVAEMSDHLLKISLLTAKQMKIVSAAGTAITEISLREGGAKNLKKTDTELLDLVNALKSADEASWEVVTGLKDGKAEIDALGATRARHMTVEEVEQDIWIEWIADLRDDDLLDEKVITDHLESLNVIGPGRIYLDDEDGLRREPPRLDVDFGSWVSDEDEEDAVNAARAKLGRYVPASSGESYYDDD